MKYVPDFDSKDFIKAISQKIDIEIEDDGMFTFDNNLEEENYGWSDFIFDFLNGASYGALGMVSRVFTHAENKNYLLKYISDISNEFDPQCFLEGIKKHKDEIIGAVKDSFIQELINPMQEQIKEIRLINGDKEKQLNKAKANLVRLKANKAEIEKQLNNITE